MMSQPINVVDEVNRIKDDVETDAYMKTPISAWRTTLATEC